MPRLRTRYRIDSLLLLHCRSAIWVGLWLARSSFWKIERHSPAPPPERWPGVVCVIPARNEADLIGETIRSLWRQGYPGLLRVIVVDDQSADGTARVAIAAHTASGPGSALLVIPGTERPPDWVGKVWAMQQGFERAVGVPDAEYVLFSDADISHGPGTLRELVSRAESGPCDLVSLMVRLRCETTAEKLMIPAFVFFFRLLYPFRRVNNPRDPLAGAAGGTMLVRMEALNRIGGLQRIRGELIDDCSLAREIKWGGNRIWLGLSETSVSTRSYGSLREIVNMIARTAYTQLQYDPLTLFGCLAGLGLTFLAPPSLATLGGGRASFLGAAAWLVMCALYVPMLRFYRQPLAWALLLPMTAAIYLWATLLSAWRHLWGRGGKWKGRPCPRSGK